MPLGEIAVSDAMIVSEDIAAPGARPPAKCLIAVCRGSPPTLAWKTRARPCPRGPGGVLERTGVASSVRRRALSMFAKATSLLTLRKSQEYFLDQDVQTNASTLVHRRTVSNARNTTLRTATGSIGRPAGAFLKQYFTTPLPSLCSLETNGISSASSR